MRGYIFESVSTHFPYNPQMINGRVKFKPSQPFLAKARTP